MEYSVFPAGLMQFMHETGTLLSVLGSGQQGALPAVYWGAFIYTGKRVSIQTRAVGRENPVGCLIISDTTAYFQKPHLQPDRYSVFVPIVVTFDRTREKTTTTVPRRRSRHPRLVNLNEKPTLCLFVAGLEQPRYSAALELPLSLNYTVVGHRKPLFNKHAEVQQAKGVQTWRPSIC